MRGGIFGIKLIAAVLTFFSLGACDLLSNKPEIDVEKAIDAAVQLANAPVLKVTGDEGGMGTASLRGTLTGIKQDIPFTLDYTAKAEYPFTGWQAMLEGSETIVAAWKTDGNHIETDALSIE